MSSASMYIDHFVHDMLDYSILSKGGEKLEKTISKFDVRKSISEIIEIQEDKIEMKNIDVQRKFNGFFDNFNICTDKRRFQQIFLNILSNAAKYTNRNGKILI